MEKRRFLYTQPVIEASTKLHTEKFHAASCCANTLSLFSDLRELTKRSTGSGHPGVAIRSLIPDCVSIDGIALTQPIHQRTIMDVAHAA